MSRDPLVEERLRALFDVSRETLDKLEALADTLDRWNKKINLIAPSTVKDVWTRHILDSAQIMPRFPENAFKQCDIGSGGGFPGLVTAILAQELKPALQLTMIESDGRKSAFLQTIIGQFDLNARVLVKRIEAAERQEADVLTARALASLPQLLAYAHLHLGAGGHAILLKGGNFRPEVDEALASWEFEIQTWTSETSAEAVVLDISNLRPR